MHVVIIILTLLTMLLWLGVMPVMLFLIIATPSMGVMPTICPKLLLVALSVRPPRESERPPAVVQLMPPPTFEPSRKRAASTSPAREPHSRRRESHHHVVGCYGRKTINMLCSSGRDSTTSKDRSKPPADQAPPERGSPAATDISCRRESGHSERSMLWNRSLKLPMRTLIVLSRSVRVRVQAG